MKRIILSLIVASLALPVFAQTKTLLNLDQTGVAIQGYDPVAFFTDNKPVKGDPKFLAKRDGAIFFSPRKRIRNFSPKTRRNTNPFSAATVLTAFHGTNLWRLTWMLFRS